MRACRLTVDFAKGERKAGIQHSIEVVERVEDGDHEEDAGEEADKHLEEDSFGEGDAGARMEELD